MDERAEFRRSALVLTSVMWVFHFALFAVRAPLAGQEQTADLLTFRAQWMLTGVGLCFVIFVVLERLQAQKFWIQVLVTHVLVGVAGLLFAGARAVLSGSTTWTAVSTFDTATYWLWFFLAWAWTLLAVRYRMQVAREERMRLQAESLAHKAKLESLRYQLNPHFLFNTLNSIAALVLDRRTEDAELMLRKLSDFLRGGLAVDPLTDVMLRDELAQQMVYLEIERVRFPGRMHVEVDVPQALERALTPSLILQPLIENSIKYAVARSSALVTIRIVAREVDGYLHLCVSDDGAAQQARVGLGVGIENVKARLEAKYGEAGQVETELKERGYSTVLHMPLIFAHT